MTAQRRGHLLRAAVVGALVSGAAVLLPAAPALAAVNANPGSLTMNPGDEKQIQITMNQGDGQDPAARITVSGLGNEISLRGPGGCNGNGSQTLTCNDNAFEGEGNSPKTLQITVTAKNPSGVQQGQTRDGSINIEGNQNGDSVNVSLKGPQQAASASEVNGKVTDQATGDGVPGAQVTVKDSAGNTHDATANSSGNYSIKSSANKPIVPGQVTVTAVKEGYTDASANGNAQSGKALTLNMRMKPTAASAGPSAPVASDPVTEDPSSPVTSAATPKNTSGDDEGTSMLSLVLIGMGVLLVLLGIGAIVLLVMRRKDDGDDPDGYGNDPNQMAPAGAGAYGGGGATMVGGRNRMNDATAIVGPQQPLDEFPDPYAAPEPAPTRVGGAYSGGYNDSQATNVAPPGYGDYGNGRGGDNYGNGGGYRDDRGYGGESQRGGYDEPRGGGGYGGGDRYADQPTGVYQGGDQGGGYPAAGGGYGANGSEYGANGAGYGGGPGAQGGQGAPGGPGGYGPNGGGANGYGGNGYEGDYGRGGGRNRSEWQD